MVFSDSERLQQTAGRLARVGGWRYAVSERSVAWSDEMCLLHGMPIGSVPTLDQALQFCAPQYRDSISRGFIDCIRHGQPFDDEFEIVDRMQRHVWVRCIGQPVHDAQGRITSIEGAMQEISDKKLFEKQVRASQLELGRLNRALRLRGACHDLMIHSRDENELLSGACELIVSTGQYLLAFVGFILHDERSTILLTASAGDHHDYFKRLSFSWSADVPNGLGPAGRTVRSNAPCHVSDVSLDADYAPLMKVAKKVGIRGITALPLREKGACFGVLCLYSLAVQTVSEEEITLLQALADDLSFGIRNIRAQDEQRQIHAAVVKIATSVSAGTSKEFFENLCRNLAESVGAHAAFVAHLFPGKPPVARTLCAVVGGSLVENFEYAVLGTPCENLLDQPSCIVYDQVASGYPQSPALSELGAKAYVGRRIDNLQGQPLGFLYVLFTEALAKVDFIMSTLQIFSARAAAEMEHVGADSRIRGQASIMDKARDAIIIRSLDSRVQFWNKGAERMYGWTASEAQSDPQHAPVHVDVVAFDAAIRQVSANGDWSGELECRRRDGSVLAVECRWTLLVDETTRTRSILAIDTDISKRKSAEREIHQLAFFDSLTKLPNRQLLQERLSLAQAAQLRSGQRSAMLFIDLDNFKTLNDTLGHATGDLLLQQVARRITDSVRGLDTVARFGGDEFVVLLAELGHDGQQALQHATRVGEKILAALRLPFQLGAGGHHGSCSIGLAMVEDGAAPPDDILKRADMAMYQAKAYGRNGLRVFSPDMQVAISSRAELESELHAALARNEFLLHFQPQVGNDGRITGAEALVRWQHPRRGMVPPADFIPVAEENGLILELGQWVLEAGCRTLADWQMQPAMAGLTLAINVSIRQFRHPGFVAQVCDVIERTGIDPKRLKLELTESLLVDDMEVTIGKMMALKARGVGFSLDDFGTGYSSLSYLKRLPLDQLKIDRSFVRDIMSDQNDAAIARTIIALGGSLGLAVIAEGVETEDQWRFLARNGCGAFQGYLFSRPLPLKAFELYVLHHPRLSH